MKPTSVKKLLKTPNLYPIILAILPVIAVFFEEKPVPYVIISLVILFFLEKDKRKNFQLNKKFLLPFLIAVLIYVLYTFLAVNIYPALKVLERQVSLMLIPLIVFSSSLNQERIRIFYKTFLVSMFLIAITSIFLLLMFIDEHGEWIEIMNKTSENKTYLQYKFPHLIGAHPTYWTYLLVLANTILLCNKSFNLNIKMVWVFLLLVLFNINILYLSARMPMFVNILIHLIALGVYYKSIKTSKTKIIGIIGGVLFAVLLALKMPLLTSKFLAISNDERAYLWPRAIEQIENNYFVLGEGLEGGRQILKKHIIENDDPRINYRGFDLHNQYLVHYMEMGILGLLSLLYLILHPLLLIKRKLNFFTLPLIGLSLLFFLTLFTEASLYYIKGIIIFSVFSTILIKNNATIDSSTTGT